MPSADDWIDQGLRAHQAGQLAVAAAAYESALRQEPEHADALNLSGVVAHQQGDSSRAILLINRAIDVDPSAADFHANLAEAHRASGHLAQAIDAYARSAQLDGTNASVWANLATMLQQSLRSAEAVGAWKHAVELEPDSADYLNNYGRALCYVDRAAEAIPVLEQARHRQPDLWAALENLAEAHLQAGRPDDALTVVRHRVDATPDDPAAWSLYAATCNDAKRHHDAIDAAHRAIQLDPGSAKAHFILGQTLEMMGEAAGASLAYARATELRPDLPMVQVKLGLAALASGRLDRAAGALRDATQMNPAYALAWFNLAIVHERMGQLEKAVEFSERARELRPDWPAVGSMIATLKMRLGRLADAEDEYRRSLEAHPHFVPALAGMGCVHADRGDQQSAITYIRRALALDPQNPSTHSVLLMSAVASGETSPHEIVVQNRAFGALFNCPSRPFPNNRDPARRLRVGYVSADLRAHSVAFFLSGLLQRHDHAGFEVIAYDDTAKPDVVSQMLRGFCDRWHRVVGMTNERLAELILEHEVDVLVDLAGHTSGNRLPLFASRVAPVQVSYLGYPASTGLTAMDYRFTDALADPPGLTDAHHTETLIRLPGSFLAYSAPPHSPEVTPLPALADGHVTFASFNNTTKLHPGVYALWADVLHAVPNSRLILKSNGFADPTLRDRVTHRFADAGIDAERLTILAKTTTMVEHLDVYGRCDVALDCFPYNGTTTTCEALWMGLPVLTLAGQMHAGRVGVSLMTNVGLPGWIAASRAEYVEIATKSAADLPRLSELRRTMRERMIASPVMDAATLSRNVEASYRAMWHDWLRKETPAS